MLFITCRSRRLSMSTASWWWLMTESPSLAQVHIIIKLLLVSLFAWQVTWTDCIIIGAIDLVWSLFVIVILLRHCRLPQGLQDVECVLCRVMSCCSQCEWQKYDWRERLWSSHSIWGQRNGERGFEPVQITVSLSLLPWLIPFSINFLFPLFFTTRYRVSFHSFT